MRLRALAVSRMRICRSAPAGRLRTSGLSLSLNFLARIVVFTRTRQAATQATLTASAPALRARCVACAVTVYGAGVVTVVSGAVGHAGATSVAAVQVSGPTWQPLGRLTVNVPLAWRSVNDPVSDASAALNLPPVISKGMAKTWPTAK